MGEPVMNESVRNITHETATARDDEASPRAAVIRDFREIIRQEIDRHSQSLGEGENKSPLLEVGHAAI